MKPAPALFRLWLLLGLLLGTPGAWAAEPLHQRTALKGVLDLRGLDLHQHPISLNGEWLWQWGELRVSRIPPAGSEPTPFPQLWNKSTWQGRPVPTEGTATYFLTVLLPPHPGPIGLDMPDAYTAFRLYVNGEPFAEGGKVGPDAASTRPFWSPQVRRLLAPGDTLRLVLQMVNFHHSKGGPYKEITLGNIDALRLRHDTNRSLDFFLTGCLFMGGLFFLGLYVYGRRDRAILYFCLFCLAYSYRIVGTDEYALHQVFPSLSWFLTIRLEYLSLYLGVGMFALYTGALYPQDANRWIIRGMVWICFAFATTTLLPPVWFTRFINWFLVLMFAYIAYAMSVYWLAARRQRPGATFALLSTAVIMLVFFAINLEYFGIAAPDNLLLFVGYVGFFGLQSLVLSFRFAFSFKKAQEQAEEGLRAKSEFLSTMSHEIRTPLNGVIGMTHLLLGGNPRPDQKEQLDVMLFSANNLLSIVNDILDFNKIEAGKISFERVPFDPSALVRNVVSSFRGTADEKRLQLRLVLDDDLPACVFGDPTRTAQVLTNLVHNAIKFTHEGSVRVSAEVGNATDRKTTLTFRVEDTGIGIAPDKQQAIFERFTQADTSMTRGFGGTGLGLTICKRILELQNVELCLRSEPGNGSTFWFTQSFELAPTPALVASAVSPDSVANGRAKPLDGVEALLADGPRQRPHAHPQAAKPLAGVEVLLVEDAPMNVLVAKGILGRWGAGVEVATNGKEALDKLDSRRHRLVLMDLHMPVMDGYEATTRLRERGETLPIIALTASLAFEVREKVRSTGLNDIVVKPFKPEELLRVLQKHLAATG